MGRYTGSMGQSSETALRTFASALIYLGALAACGEAETTTVNYSASDSGAKMPLPQKAVREQCYGIALAQYNDCAAGKGTHCAGTAEKDYMPDRWKYVPAGQCEGLDGTLEPREEKPDQSRK